MIKSILLVGMGSFLGGALRYFSGWIVQSQYSSAFPLSTFLVNSIGCLLAGLLFGMFSNGNILGHDWKLFLIVGFCGGLTTFSAFALENITLLKSGQFVLFAIYTFLSILVSFTSVYAGYAISRLI